jgi:hypothetical protein
MALASFGENLIGGTNHGLVKPDWMTLSDISATELATEKRDRLKTCHRRLGLAGRRYTLKNQIQELDIQDHSAKFKRTAMC